MKIRIFSIDNPIFNAISRIGDMFILSFIWLITSIPIITLGASTTALMGTTMKIARKCDTNIIKDYFIAFKNNFLQSTVIFLIMSATGLVLIADLYYWKQFIGTTQALIFGGLSVGVAVIYLFTLIFVFPVQAVFNNKIKDTIKTAFLMSVRHWPTSLVITLFLGGLLYVCDINIIVAFFVLLFGTGLTAFILSARFVCIFAKYNSQIANDIANN